MTHSAVYFGRVMHARLTPFRHQFAYKVFSLFVDLSEVADLGRRSRLFSYNSWNLFSFHDRDFGPRDGSALRPWLDRHLAATGIDLEGGSVRILCFPRVLGYVFNPLTVWYCYDPGENLVAVLYDVSNTFGQAHAYLLPVAPEQRTGPAVHQRCAKQFHVSPFMEMDATYRFQLTKPDQNLALRVDQEDHAGRSFIAAHVARRAPLRDAVLLRAFLSHPLLNLKIIGGIHWQALRLWLKGARLRRRPAPPPTPVTIPNAQ